MFDICFHPRILLCILNRHVAASENQVQNVESLLCICDVNNDNDNDDDDNDTAYVVIYKLIT